MDLRLLFELPAFLLGLLFGSFLNVCIARLPRGESVVAPRSRCPECGHTIRWHDNIPLLSWFLLRRRCRDCGQPIAARYPLTELALGLWFALAAYNFRVTASNSATPLTTEQIAMAVLSAVGFAVLGFLLLGLMAMDWQTMLLPDAFTITGIAIGFFLVCIQAIFLGPGEDQINLTSHHIRLASPGNVVDHGNLFFTGPEALVMGRLATICGVGLLLLAIRSLYKLARKREGMGLGDVKMLAMIAAFLGFWPAIVALFAGVLAACAFALILLGRRRANTATKLPFGSFLALGGLVAALYGEPIIAAYTTLLR